MDDNEKLIEAAKLIKEHCDSTKTGNPCIFSVYETCEGPYKCRIGFEKYFPTDWVIPKISRWTDADIALAKALMEFGVRSIYREKYASSVRYEQQGTFDCNWFLPKNAFASLKQGEMARLKDIVAEGENYG